MATVPGNAGFQKSGAYLDVLQNPADFLLACFVYLLASGIHNALTQKSPVVYLAYLNISVGEDVDSYLSDGFVSYLGRNPEKEEVYRYFNLYLSDNPSAENHQYAYTSNLKAIGFGPNEQGSL